MPISSGEKIRMLPIRKSEKIVVIEDPFSSEENGVSGFPVGEIKKGVSIEPNRNP